MSFLLPSQDEAVRKKRRTGLIAGVAVLAAAALGWGPVKAGYQRLHARKLAAEAVAYAAQKRYDAALASANEAVAAGADDTRLRRLLLELHAKAGAPQAFPAWAALARRTDLTFEDRRELFRWAVAWGQQEAADLQWFELQKETPVSIETMRLAAGYFEMRGEPERAAFCARETIAANPGDAETRVLLGRILLRDGTAMDRAVGRKLLLEQAARQDALGLRVLRLLAASRDLPPFEANECLGRLGAHPLKTKSDDLAAADLQAQLTPYKRERILADAAEAFVGSGGDPVAAGRWLLNHGAFAEALALATPERARERPELAFIRLDGLAGLGRWAEIERSLAENEQFAPPFERSLFRARAAMALDQARLAELHWKQAQEHAGKDPAKLLTLATYAKASQAWEAARQALLTLAETKLFARKAYEELIGMAAARGNPEEVKTLLRQLAELFPDDPAIENDLAYLALLDSTDIDAALATAEKLVRAHPQFLSYRVTLALAHLRRNRAVEAEATLNAAPVNWAQASPGQRAIYAAALGSGGKTAAAREIGRGIPLENLKPQERELLKPWL